VEQQVVALTVSAKNNCEYCVGAHSAIAGMVKMSAQTLHQLCLQQTLSDADHEALRQFTLALLEHRGGVSQEKQQTFLAAGYRPQHMLDTLSIVALKTLSNYTNHLAHTPLDKQFSEFAWEKQQREKHA
jgi:AhpD family alkylhydroperoxidase